MTTKKVETWMPLLVDKYLGDTTHLSTEQHGAYLLLLLTCWKRDGKLPADDEQLANITRLPMEKWRRHGPVLMAFFEKDGNAIVQKRLTIELERAKANVEQRSAAGKASAEARKAQRDGNGRSTAVATDDATVGPTEAQREPQRNGKPIPIPSSLRSEVSKASPSHPPGGGRFAEFWLVWPKNERKQDKAKCLDHWKRNALDDKADAILADVRTKRATTKWQEGFVEAPLVYLRGKRWEDGVEPESAATGVAAQEQSRALLDQMEADRQASQTPEAKAAARQAMSRINAVIKRVA